ncbi:MAG: AMP-binding protein, partial [Bacteroidota bacterium]
MFLHQSDKSALIWKDEVVTYNQLLSNITKYTTLFDETNTSKIAIFAENKLEWVYAFYTGFMTKSIIVPIDFMLPVDDLAYILNDCKPEVIFYSNETMDKVESALQNSELSISKINFDEFNLDDIKTEVEILPEIDEDDTAVIMYTSGTTGKPKGVMLSYGNILSNIRGVTEYVEVYAEDLKTLVLLPLHHILPLAGSVIAPLYSKGIAIFTPTLQSEDVVATLEKHKINIIIAVPRFYSLIRKTIREKIDSNKVATLLFKLAEKINSQGFSKKLFKKVHQKFGGEVKYMVCGGAKLDEGVAKDFKTLGFEVLEGYGMTETSPMITFTRPGRVKVGSPGEVFPGMEVKFKDGEILARGPNVMKGYYNKVQETEETLRDGWIHTGDLGHLDDEGFLFVTGRRKELIVLSNGKNITPDEIETKITEIDEVVEEVGVYLENDQLLAVIYPNMVKAKSMEISDINEYLRWEVIAKYNEGAPSYRRISNFTAIDEPLPRTRLSKLKRFMLPEIGKGITQQKKDEEDLDFEEYRIIKEFLSREKEKEIYPSDHLEMDVNLDSLDKITFLSFLSSTFGVELDEEDL